MNRLPHDDTHGLAVERTPPASGPEIYIYRLAAQETLTFHVFSRELFGIWVHWDRYNKRSTPHYSDTGNCDGCQRELPKRWKGFLHTWCVEKKQQLFLELTPASANALKAQLATGETLRGKGIFVQRTKGKNGRLLVRVLPGQIDPQAMPEELDPLRSLMAIWGIHPRATGGREFPIPSVNGKPKVRECL
jgi:hypothetical protein